MPEPRVIFVNRVYWPSETATAQLLTDLAESLVARGWPVHVITAGSGAGERNGVIIHCVGAVQPPGGLLVRARHHREFARCARAQLSTLVQPGDIVVLKTDPPLLAAACTALAQSRGARVVQWIQDIYPEIVPAHFGAWIAPLFWLQKWRRNRAWHAADLCLPVGADMRKMVLAQGTRADQVVVMPNWAPRELDTPANPAEVDALRRAWGLAEKFVVAYSGNLGRVHEFDTVLGTAKMLRAHPEIVVFFIGDGPRLAEVQADAERRQLTNIRFLPPQPRAKLAASLAVADVQLVTLRPGFERLVNPSKLAGILAAGRPAIYVGAPGGEISELLEREKCGFSAPAGNPLELYGAIRGIRFQPEQAATFGRNARACYTRHFSLGAATARWDELLRKLIVRR
ncbi:MAG TPA: glycosyltransferase family 4 protein [Candidatus Didemnitutus sp.]|nr:glycosyltransferase family 4 protein [Candidatus Didemnitutus sp.]